MKTSVKIAAHPETGAVVTMNEKKGKDGKEYGVIRVSQTIVSLENGIANKSSRSAFITLEKSISDLLAYQENQALAGQIVRKESFSPLFEGQEPKKYPEGNVNAGKDFLVNGKKVYFKDTYTEDMSATDTLLKSIPIEAPIASIAGVKGEHSVN